MSYTNDLDTSATTKGDSFLDVVNSNEDTVTDLKGDAGSESPSSSATLCGYQSSTLRGGLLRSLTPTHFPPQYSRLRADEQDMEPSEQILLAKFLAVSRSLWLWRCFSSLLALTLLAVGIGFGTRTLQVTPTLPGADITSSSATLKDRPLSCGNTTAAAVRRDCEYNPLSNRWLPKRCVVGLSEHVQPMLKEIDPMPFKFYRDPAGSQEIHGHDWAGIELGTIVWTTERHHITHCINLLVQGAAGLAFGGILEEHARDWKHVKHCADTILTAGKGLPGWNDVNSFVHVKAGECY